MNDPVPGVVQISEREPDGSSQLSSLVHHLLLLLLHVCCVQAR